MYASKRPDVGDENDQAQSKRVKKENRDDDGAKFEDSSWFVNEYKGRQICTSDEPVDRISVGDITPERFYLDYISQRKPCVLTGTLSDPKWKVPQNWTDSSYLRRVAGNVQVMVEKRTTIKDMFGQGNETPLPFSDFLTLLNQGSDLHYLTTQDVKTDSTGRPHVMSELMQQLSDDFPIRPKLMGNLVPQNINVWMGHSSSTGSSTGLHHDYHDNLYILIQGRKRFRLYSPADAENMYTRGVLCKVHANGRINYVGEVTNADGSDVQAEVALDASIRQDQAARELELAEEAVERGDEGAEVRLEAAEKALDEAMEAVMDAEEHDGPTNMDDEEEQGNDEKEDEEVSFWKAAAKEKKKQEGAKQCLASYEEKEANKGSANNEEHVENYFFEEEGRVVDKTVKNPLNFSTVDTTLDKDELHKQFPKFLAAKATTVEIQVGEMLYLPASWFHEVTSYGGDGGSNTDKEGNGSGLHIAFNYWFHPPDGSSFDQPYTSQFWNKDWKLRNS